MLTTLFSAEAWLDVSGRGGTPYVVPSSASSLREADLERSERPKKGENIGEESKNYPLKSGKLQNVCIRFPKPLSCLV